MPQQNFMLRLVYKKNFLYNLYPDYGSYPDISGFGPGPDYPGFIRIFFLIYPDDGFYPDRNTSRAERVFFFKNLIYRKISYLSTPFCNHVIDKFDSGA